jgi:hypothetical protein
MQMKKESDLFAEIVDRMAVLHGSEEEIQGANADEIGELEADAGGRLPRTYRRFLEVMGRSAGALLRGSDYSIAQDHRLRLRDSAQRIIDRSQSGWELPADAFVFLVHHGYQFLFFNLDGDDPEVYRFTEADSEPKQIAGSLTEFFRLRIENHERLVRDRVNRERAQRAAPIQQT